MEQRTIKKGKLKRRILWNIFMIWSGVMIISSVTGFWYFRNIVRKQAIKDEQIKLEQLEEQIEFIREDIDNFTKVIISDDVIQEALKVELKEDIFDQVKRKNTIAQRLSFFNNLRPYVAGAFMESAKGEKFVSSSDSNSAEHIELKFDTKEIVEFKRDLTAVFSEPYYGIDNWSKGKKIICYRSFIYNPYNFGEKLGTVYIEIYLDYFLKMLSSYGDEQNENIWLINERNQVLYGDEKFLEVLSSGSFDKDGINKTGENCVIMKAAGNTGWILYTRLTGTYLRKRSGFVLQFFVISFLLAITVILLFTSKMLENMINPISRLSEKMENTEYGKSVIEEVVHTDDEIQTLYECYNNMVEEIQKGIQQRIEYEKKTREMEFNIMLSQINPHYLYNVLHTVVYLSAMGKNKEVSTIINSLIYTLQETLKLGDKKIETTVEQELELTRCYMQIQEYRYPGMFQIQLECEESEKNCILPKTTIQPLVENALLHGILPTEKSGIIYIRISKEGQFLKIEVEDTGLGISRERLQMFENGKKMVYETGERQHIGVTNIRDRILYLYGEPCGMRIKRGERNGTTVTLKVPYMKESDGE